MSAGENSERSENFQTANANNTDNSSSSDSGFSSSGGSNRSQKEELKRGGGPREKPQSPSQNQENVKTGSNNFFSKKFPRGGKDGGDSDFFEDPFFSERTSKFKKRFANRPRLSERIFGNKKGASSVFDNDSFVDDLRKKIQEEKKMFFDGGADPFASAFGAGGRPTSPVGGSSASAGRVRELADKVTNVVMNYTEIEAKVREATNDDPWGPTGTLKHELSQATYSYDLFLEVMGMLWKRIAENKRSPRRIYKSLLVLHHLLLHGSDRVVRATQDRLYEVRQLQDYHAVEDPGFTLNAIIPASGTETKDGEANVRHKAKEMVKLIQDEERLRDERKKARKNRDKYVGIGSVKMMTSKWSDDYDYGNNEDEKSSPPSRSKSKPYSDTDADFSSSMSSSSNNNFRSKPSPPSPAIEAEDFDPRGGEVNDFGDFRSAPTIATTPKTGSSSFPSGMSNNTSSDFADFQSAFSETTTPAASVDIASLSLGQEKIYTHKMSTSHLPYFDPLMSNVINGFHCDINKGVRNTMDFITMAVNNQQSDDLLGLSFDIGGVSGGGGNSQSSGLSNFNAPASSNFLPQLGGPVGGFSSGIVPPVSAAPARQPVSLPGAFPPMGIPANNLQTPSPVVQFPSPVGFPQQQTSLVQTSAVPPAQFQQQQPMSVTSLSNNDDALDLFGSSSSVPAAHVLQPATKASNGAIPSSNSATNNINNNSNPSLKGTTWSDLNIGLSDLNLSRSNSKNSPVKTTINQMRAPSTTAANNFAAFK